MILDPKSILCFFVYLVFVYISGRRYRYFVLINEHLYADGADGDLNIVRKLGVGGSMNE